MRESLVKLKSRFLEPSDSGETESDLQAAISDTPRATKGFNQNLIKDYKEPLHNNIFLDENILIDLQMNADRSTTAYLPVNSSDQSDIRGEDGLDYRRLEIREPLEETVQMLEKAAEKDVELYFPSTFAHIKENKTNDTVHQFLQENATPVEIEPIPTSDYPEDAGIVAEALERDAVIVTYDEDFTDTEDFTMRHGPEIYTPSQLYHTIKEN
ncbi:hypothetical protein GKQ38_00900 [Candidatus Nanohaloarchaea archaeon]|nr:hypothetical protein GKQ38_00900 [Candidatus Nanohaloarchaea archaeon]